MKRAREGKQKIRTWENMVKELRKMVKELENFI
jgi:exonuclease VII small subunit